VPRTSSSTSLADTMSSIIPIVALSKDNNGNLSVSSLQTIIDSMKRDGYTFNTNAGKQNALQVIQNQRNQLRNNYKNTMKDYLLNSLEYISDGTSLNRAKDIDDKIKELDDLSGYIQTMKIEGFVEGFLDNTLSKERTVNENLLEETGQTKGIMQMLWLVNIVALGTFLYIR
jgi:predicted Rdx family selenoprotein